MTKSNELHRELEGIKKEIATWPEWMQREARFEGEAKYIQDRSEIKEQQPSGKKDDSRRR